MNQSTPNPTLSMVFIAGILFLMSVFSFLTPNTDLSSQENPSESISLTSTETTPTLTGPNLSTP